MGKNIRVVPIYSEERSELKEIPVEYKKNSKFFYMLSQSDDASFIYIDGTKTSVCSLFPYYSGNKGYIFDLDMIDNTDICNLVLSKCIEYFDNVSIKISEYIIVWRNSLNLEDFIPEIRHKLERVADEKYWLLLERFDCTNRDFTLWKVLP